MLNFHEAILAERKTSQLIIAHLAFHYPFYHLIALRRSQISHRQCQLTSRCICRDKNGVVCAKLAPNVHRLSEKHTALCFSKNCHISVLIKVIKFKSKRVCVFGRLTDWLAVCRWKSERRGVNLKSARWGTLFSLFLYAATIYIPSVRKYGSVEPTE